MKRFLLALGLLLSVSAPALADDSILGFTFAAPENPNIRTDRMMLYVCAEQDCSNAMHMPSNGAWRFTCSPAIPEGPNNPPQDGHCTSFGGNLPAFAYLGLPNGSGPEIRSRVFPVPHHSIELRLTIDDDGIEVTVP